MIKEEYFDPLNVVFVEDGASSYFTPTTVPIEPPVYCPPIKKRKKTINWKTELESGQIVMEENPRDKRILRVLKNGEFIGFRCATCEDRFIATKGKINGAFYTHIANCAVQNGLIYHVNKNQKNEFAEKLNYVQANDLETTIGLTTVAKKELYQFLLDFGYNARKESPQCPTPKIDDLLCNSTILRSKFRSKLESKSLAARNSVGTWLKNNSGCLMIDFTTKLKNLYGVVAHVFDDKWKLRVLPLDVQVFNESITEESIRQRITSILFEFEVNWLDIHYVTGSEINLMPLLPKDNSVVCVSQVLRMFSKRIFKLTIEKKYDEDLCKRIQKIYSFIQQIKKLFSLIHDRPSLEESLAEKIKFKAETSWLHLVRQFMQLTGEDLDMLKNADESMKKIIMDLTVHQSLIAGYLIFMEKIEKIILKLETEKEPTISLVKPLLKTLEIELEEMIQTETNETIKTLAVAGSYCWNDVSSKLSNDVYDVAALLNPNEVCKIRNLFGKDGTKTMAEKLCKAVKKYEIPIDSDLDFLPNDGIEGEAVRYLRDAPKESVENFDLINWWKINEVRYPAVSKLSKKVLSMPATCSSVGKLFPFTNSMTSDDRKRLDEPTINDLINYRIILSTEK